MQTIYLDAGHEIGVTGKLDPGAVGLGGTTEASVTRDMVSRIGNLLRAKGYQVIEGPPQSLNADVRQANAAGADAYISIHCNSAGDPSANGVEVWYSRTDSRRFAQFALDRLVQYLVDPGGWLKRSVKVKNRGVKRGSFAVLRLTRMPSILAELLFINNPAEEKLLNDRYALQEMAQALADAADDFFTR